MEHNTKVKLRMALSGKDTVCKCGLMELVMKVCGKMEYKVAEESSTILMVMFMKVSYLYYIH